MYLPFDSSGNTTFIVRAFLCCFRHAFFRRWSLVFFFLCGTRSAIVLWGTRPTVTADRFLSDIITDLPMRTYVRLDLLRFDCL